MKIGNRLFRLALIGLLATTLWLAPMSGSVEAATLKATITNRLVKLEYAPVGDIRGHVLGLSAREGTAVFEDGQTADYAMVGTFDFTVGKGGVNKGYTKMTFKDGSFITFTWKTDVGVGPNKLPTSKGTGKITGGGGRFKGIQGTVSFEGKQSKPTSEDPKREMVIDAAIDYALGKSE